MTGMKDDEIQGLMMRVVDGIASPDEEAALAEAIHGDDKWETELRAFQKIKEATDGMRFKELPDSYWQQYWENVYCRLERGLGWILISAGAVILLCFALYVGLARFFTDPGIPPVVKVGVSAAGLGSRPCARRCGWPWPAACAMVRPSTTTGSSAMPCSRSTSRSPGRRSPTSCAVRSRRW